MARFRPARLFRRLSSRNDARNTSKSPHASQHSHSHSYSASPSPPNTSHLASPPPPPLPIYPVPAPKQVRKSSSLPRLRKKSATATARSVKSSEDFDRDREASVPEVPEAITEVRESGDFLHAPLRESKSGEELGSEAETVSVSVEKDAEHLDLAERKEAGVSTEELRLEEVDQLSHQPIVTLQHPTPDVSEEVRGLTLTQERSPLIQHFDSGEVTLASSTPPATEGEEEEEEVEQEGESATISPPPPPPPISTDATAKPTLPELTRRPSIIDSANAKIVKTLLNAPAASHERSSSDTSAPLATSATEYFSQALPNMAAMLHRKIWVKRPGASATLVQIREDYLVDDVREMILTKYRNSLGRTFDAPDMTLHILSRPEQGAGRTERILGPEEDMCQTIDQMYPGGQTVDEALIISVPHRRTPKASPRVFQEAAYQRSYQALDEYRPLENGTDYFPQMPVVIPATLPQTSSSHESHSSQRHHSVVGPLPQSTVSHAAADHPRSISVLNTGQIPPLPSPGGQSRRHQHRPKYNRQPTSSPTIISHPPAGAVIIAPPAPDPHMRLVHRQSARPRLDSSAAEAPRPNGIVVPPAPPLPDPPAPEAPPTNRDISGPPTPSSAGPPGGPGYGLRPGRQKKPRKTTPEAPNSRRNKDSSSGSSAPPNTGIANLLDASVPPINVLIVEDNIINLRILESLMKRLKVRWQTAMNGQIAVDKWKAGGFHLVLMDIQMPVMNGLQATKEIRRLESVNGIGVFSSTSPDDDDNARAANGDPLPSPPGKEKQKQDDSLPALSDGMFKSPIIIVALTASSLQSDRHEALAAGCNDFLTKPVNFVWLERKVKEWGCMQALIDFDGWRKWKDYAAHEEAGKSEEEKARERERADKERLRAEKMAKLLEKQAKAKEEREREGKKKRISFPAAEAGGSPALLPKEEVNGGPLEKVGSAALRPGRLIVGEAALDLA